MKCLTELHNADSLIKRHKDSFLQIETFMKDEFARNAKKNVARTLPVVFLSKSFNFQFQLGDLLSSVVVVVVLEVLVA